MDILSFNGRQECIKKTIDLATFEPNHELCFKIKVKNQFACLEYFKQEGVLVLGDSKGILWSFDYNTGQ